MKNTSFGTIYCVRQQNNFFKLILPYLKPISRSIPELINKKNRDDIEEELLRTLGFLAGSCVRKGMIIEKIELILPPMGEYLFLQERLQKILKDEGHKFSVSIGVKIDLPNAELDDIDINIPLGTLSNNNAGNN